MEMIDFGDMWLVFCLGFVFGLGRSIGEALGEDTAMYFLKRKASGNE